MRIENPMYRLHLPLARRGSTSSPFPAGAVGVTAVVLAVAGITSCSGDNDSDDAGTSAPSAATAGATSTEVGASEPPRPGPIPNVAGDGDGPSVEDQLAAATIPLAPEDCRSADVDAVTDVIGTEVAFTVGQIDPSGRSLCRYVDSDETTLVRVLVTGAAADPVAADAFAELSAEPEAVLIGATTVRVGRLAARLDGALIEITVEPDAVLDDAEAGEAALSLLDVVAG
jgi:hypothetical protein